jgi:hypothetical protein
MNKATAMLFLNYQLALFFLKKEQLTISSAAVDRFCHVEQYQFSVLVSCRELEIISSNKAHINTKYFHFHLWLQQQSSINENELAISCCKTTNQQKQNQSPTALNCSQRL